MAQSKADVVWKVKEFCQLLRERQLNQFDVNIGVSGRRGNGKSSLLYKIFACFRKDGFKMINHMVYERNDIMRLLANQRFGFCWDDEGINSGYKRNFQDKGQQELIKLITNYRDNYNIHACALPFFYSLDKDLRELIFCHIHIIERGVAVILMPLEDQIHSSDPWDTKMNIKIEEWENQRIQKNPKSSFRYHKLTTFAGYLLFKDLKPKQRQIYERIKKMKRAKVFKIDQYEENTKEGFYDKVYKGILSKQVTKEGLMQMCLIEGKKYSTVISRLNQKLKDAGEIRTLKEILPTEKREFEIRKEIQKENLVNDMYGK